MGTHAIVVYKLCNISGVFVVSSNRAWDFINFLFCFTHGKQKRGFIRLFSTTRSEIVPIPCACNKLALFWCNEPKLNFEWDFAKQKKMCEILMDLEETRVEAMGRSLTLFAERIVQQNSGKCLNKIFNNDYTCVYNANNFFFITERRKVLESGVFECNNLPNFFHVFNIFWTGEISDHLEKKGEKLTRLFAFAVCVLETSFHF